MVFWTPEILTPGSLVLIIPCPHKTWRDWLLCFIIFDMFLDVWNSTFFLFYVYEGWYRKNKKKFPLNLYRQIQGMYRTNFGVIGWFFLRILKAFQNEWINFCSGQSWPPAQTPKLAQQFDNRNKSYLEDIEYNLSNL